ncbi:DUF2510 domain-containing protein [Demequina subtropica]|uniref:DUF2510 domain-containing protein n=1 Tax=Demequina subtropica TaxID=1638989 RepID=UPI000781F1BC|nr:DUF2510 domain-containing protein [Demequina subtropica]
MNESRAAASWHPDSLQPGRLRYWDGVAWTDHVRPAEPPQPASPAVSAPPGLARGFAEPEPSRAPRVGMIVATVLGALSVALLAVSAALYMADTRADDAASAEEAARAEIRDQEAAERDAERAAEEADSRAKADVSTLGKEIATHLVDHDELPTITVEGGEYVFTAPEGEYAREPVSEGVELVEIAAGDPAYATWCAAVRVEGGAVGAFRYSAQDGLAEGSCG